MTHPGVHEDQALLLHSCREGTLSLLSLSVSMTHPGVHEDQTLLLPSCREGTLSLLSLSVSMTHPGVHEDQTLLLPSCREGTFSLLGLSVSDSSWVPRVAVLAVTFQICIQNRYKLNKKYRKWLSQASTTGDSVQEKGLLHQAKLAAGAENADNAAEQKRQLGKRVRYGEIVQLKHAFTNKYVHMCTSQTSQKDKNNMMVQIFDQIVFESIKSPGHFYHASQGFQVEHLTYG
ncbi:hypothetical protein ACOMHN_054026 [Nucella lapillus]